MEEFQTPEFQPVEVGNLDEVKETRSVVPATKGVKVQITKVDLRNNKENTYRSLNLTLKIVDGVDAEGKYKNKVVFGRVCYYADPTAYTKDFFKTKQHLIALKQLSKATGIDAHVIDMEFVNKLITANPIKVDITVRKRIVPIDDGTGTIIEEERMENEVRNYRAIPASELV